MSILTEKKIDQEEIENGINSIDQNDLYVQIKQESHMILFSRMAYRITVCKSKSLDDYREAKRLKEKMREGKERLTHEVMDFMKATANNTTKERVYVIKTEEEDIDQDFNYEFYTDREADRENLFKMIESIFQNHSVECYEDIGGYLNRSTIVNEKQNEELINWIEKENKNE